MGEKYKLAGKLYKTKISVQEHAKKILAGNEIRVCLSGDNLAFMKDFLLNFHPKSEEKIGSGIKNIFIVEDEYMKNKCFCVERTDRTCVNFSTNKISVTKQTSKRNDMTQAYRQAIKDQIINFKKSSEQVCVKCGDEESVIHVDHFVPTFQDLVKYFEIEYEDFNKQELAKEEDNRFHWKDDELWRNFHSSYTHLRVLCDTCNLTRKRKRS